MTAENFEVFETDIFYCKVLGMVDEGEFTQFPVPLPPPGNCCTVPCRFGAHADHKLVSITKAWFRRRASAVPNLIAIRFDSSTAEARL